MAMRRHSEDRQSDFWIATADVARSPGHPFYERLKAVLRERGFDRFAEGLCERFYAAGKGRPGIEPNVYFRMLLIWYFEGLDSERGIAWRCADSLGLREFLGYNYGPSPGLSGAIGSSKVGGGVALYGAVGPAANRYLKSPTLREIGERILDFFSRD